MESGTISDGQISASSEPEDGNRAAKLGRLHFPARDGHSWSVTRNDANQWLQVDLMAQKTTVTQVATQGSNGHKEWVSTYKLQYSSDGLSFKYYKEQGQNGDTVR